LRTKIGLETNDGPAPDQEIVMARHTGRWWFSFAVTSLLLLAATPGRGEETKLAISGYDPVAYFTEGKPVPGRSEFEYTWHNARWLFASAAHRDAFAGNPDRYAPQYDGYCAMGVSVAAAHKDTVDPEAWAIVDGKLYLTHTRRSLEIWRENAAANIKQADQNWPKVKEQAEPVIIGPPCRDQPPTVVVTVEGGAKRVIVGAQLALDSDGKLVGKGDMRAQIEQVGKNIDACLKAAGATTSDIILTRTYVADMAAFSKNAETNARYLGSELPANTIVEPPKLSPKLAGSDFLVEIEAVANVN
jgi:enamine deaminase RidA (YjgF/YER057c/UK114 family)